MTNINDLKTSIVTKISTAMPDVTVADEFCNRELYSRLQSPIIVVYLKSVVLNGISLGRGMEVNATPVIGSKADITIGFKLFCNSNTALPNDISTKLATLLLLDDTFDISSFSCNAASYSLEYEVIEQECEGKLSLIFAKEAEV